jgi:hypothetical protein
MQRIENIRTLIATSNEIQPDETEMLALVESKHRWVNLNYSIALMFLFCQTTSSRT